ncbi:general transcription factor IIF subunit 1-like [Nasonia vitripennis]|uniref:Transcription initiation factor IIF subunit alpha n=1 Tax=Nasonia vitripennis TaxID=7425 RepID=A0A7M7IV95_NASVI|nr:general transcription factor IIF subunit 1-like [Nasonia vitripennis]
MNSARLASAATVSEPNLPPQITEFSVRVPKNTKKKFNVMKFNTAQGIDFNEWKDAKMERENNRSDFNRAQEEIPKYGAGSEFGREAREEARRKKFGIISQKYNPEAQPWILKPTGKTGKKFKGNRNGGIGDNSAYYVFVSGDDGNIEAFPLKEWYNFQPVQRYNALSAEEAEMEFNQRNKVMNYFSVMMRKRLRNDEENDEDSEMLKTEKGKKTGKDSKVLKISEMDDWMDSDDDDDSDSDEKENKKKSDEEDEDDKKKKKKSAGKKKKKNVSDDEAFEESDDGDEEGRECDYISDSSASESELELQKEIKSVAEEDALRKLLVSDEEDEDEDDKEKKDEAEKSDETDGDKDDKDKKKAGTSNGKKSKGKNAQNGEKKNGTASSTDAKSSPDQKPASTPSPRSATPTIASAAISESRKRPLTISPEPSTAMKMKVESNYMPSSSGSNSETGITEDAVRRYLMRKPMTTTELLQKFKAKKTGHRTEEIVVLITNILKKINPIRKKVKDKLYLSLKPEQ